MYKVPMEIPKHCNQCPFGMCNFNYPFAGAPIGRSISKVDGKENKKGYYGYVCAVEFDENKRYTKVVRAKINENIKKPKWCKLMKLEEVKDNKEE